MGMEICAEFLFPRQMFPSMNVGQPPIANVIFCASWARKLEWISSASVPRVWVNLTEKTVKLFNIWIAFIAERAADEIFTAAEQMLTVLSHGNELSSLHRKWQGRTSSLPFARQSHVYSANSNLIGGKSHFPAAARLTRSACLRECEIIPKSKWMDLGGLGTRSRAINRRNERICAGKLHRSRAAEGRFGIEQIGETEEDACHIEQRLGAGGAG